MRTALLIVLLPLCLSLLGCGLGGGGLAEPPADSAKIHVRYRWTAVDEQQSGAGLEVYRSEDLAGPFTCLTPDPVRLRGAAPGDVRLVMTDYGVRMGRTYYYYLARVMPDGKRVKATDVAAASAVLPLQREDWGPYASWREREREARFAGEAR